MFSSRKKFVTSKYFCCPVWKAWKTGLFLCWIVFSSLLLTKGKSNIRGERNIDREYEDNIETT